VFPKRGAVALGLTAIALVLLISFRTPSDAAAQGADTATVDGGTTGTAAQSGSRTVDGPVVDTRYGPVQVEVTLDGSTIASITAIQLPDGDRRSAQISDRAAPTLQSQALQAQSADIDGVSGATYTSTAYERSLQAALDSAGG
jgi:uncharacterized protein with FMN-binding domain